MKAVKSVAEKNIYKKIVILSLIVNQRRGIKL